MHAKVTLEKTFGSSLKSLGVLNIYKNFRRKKTLKYHIHFKYDKQKLQIRTFACDNLYHYILHKNVKAKCLKILMTTFPY